MALKKCKECGGEVSTKAQNCPKCGAKAPRKTSIVTWMVLLMIVATVWLSSGNPEVPNSTTTKASTPVAPVQKAKDATDQATREFLWVEKGKESVLSRLKDPDSVKFKDVYFNKSKSEIPMTCGQVNAKNSYGGYGGFQHFISAGSPDRTWLEGDVKDFEKLWNQYCR